MTRARTAIAALLVISTAAVSILVGTALGDTGGGGFRYTHRFTVTARLVDRWTIDDKSFGPYCGRSGSGAFAVTFHTTKAWRVTPRIDPTAGTEVRGGIGRWVLAIGVEGGLGSQDTKPRPGVAAVTSVDNTVPGPNNPNSAEPCPAFDKADCGASRDGHSKVDITGYDRRRLTAGVVFAVPETGSHGVRCFLGSLEGGFGDRRLGGGGRDGEMFLTMPNAQAFARRGVVRVTRTSHKRISTRDGGLSATDDVTQTVTVTFTHL